MNVDQVVEEVVLDTMKDLRDLFPRRVAAMPPDEEHALVELLQQRARSWK